MSRSATAKRKKKPKNPITAHRCNMHYHTLLFTYFPMCKCRFVTGKGKVHFCTGTEALYRPYGPQEELRYSSALS